MERWEGKQNIADISMTKSERVMERQNKDTHTSNRMDGSKLLGTQKSTSQGENIDLHDDDDDDGQIIPEDGLNTEAEAEFVNAAEDIRKLSLMDDKGTLGEEEAELMGEKWTERLQDEVLYDSDSAFVLSCTYSECSFICYQWDQGHDGNIEFRINEGVL